MSKKLTTQQKIDKIVELFKEIEKVGYRGSGLMVHNVPILDLGKKWKVVLTISADGKSKYFTAHLLDNDKEEKMDITLFSKDLLFNQEEK